MRAMRRLAAVVASFSAVLGVVHPAAMADDRSGVELSLSSTEAGERLRRDLSGVLSLRATPDSTCLAVRVDDGSVFESKPDVGLVPASLMKVVTSAAALEVMAPNEVFRTEVFVRAEALAAVEDGVLRGDIYLVGGGDPVLSTPGYIRRYPEPVAHTDITELGDRVLAALTDHGITRIEGRLVGDDSWFSDEERDYTAQYPVIAGTSSPKPVWARSFVALNTVGQLSGLSLNDGYSSYSGSVAGAGRRANVRAADPARHAAAVLGDVLEARGMVIRKRPASGTAPRPAERASLGSIESPPLSEILIRLLSRSDNTTAEMLLKEIGRRTAGSARSAAVSSVQEIMEQRLGPLAEGLVIVDGSGLSSQNRVTCAAVVELLSQAGPGSPLVEGLAVTGERGTLRYCRPAVSGQDQHNAIRAKTGTLNESTALAGVTVAADGEVLTFAMMANRPSIIALGNCNSIRRGVMNAVARYTYRDLDPSNAAQSGDREVLEALFDATRGHDWFNAYGWGTDWPLARWHGVSTDASGRVTGVVLNGPFGNGLTGTLPEELADLSELALLDLSGNDLSDSLPAGITGLSELRELRITGTSLCLSESLQSSAAWFESISEAPVPECTSFDDTVGHPHADALEDLAGRGVLEGTECAVARMCPDEPIDRATLAVWLLRVLGPRLPGASGTSRFADVDPESLRAPYVERFAELGITRGCARTPLRFCPDASLRRGHMAAFLTRALNLSAKESVEFSDATGSIFRSDIAAVAEAGVMSYCEGKPTHFCLRDAVTRGQAATILVTARGFAPYLIISDEQFKVLANEVELPNLSPLGPPPPITGHIVLDRRIRQLAIDRGYQLRPMPADVGQLVVVEADRHRLQPEAAQAYQELKAAARAAGLNIRLISAYRSYDDQRPLFLRNVGNPSNETEIVRSLRVSSIPGYSRHHTGYTIDLTEGQIDFRRFAQTDSYAWLAADNYAKAKEYGWIPSYPPMAKNQGPDPEAWEFTYVGRRHLINPDHQPMTEQPARD